MLSLTQFIGKFLLHEAIFKKQMEPRKGFYGLLGFNFSKKEKLNTAKPLKNKIDRA